MILVADSGSTKADWKYQTDSASHLSFTTKGLNPFFHDQKFILDELSANTSAVKIKKEVKRIYFFGAGCSIGMRNKIIKEGLELFFENAAVIVEHDMLGCALSVCNGKKGIACILGTGSNVSYFDGKDIIESRHGLGYVLGDEGSGSFFGKKLLSSFIYKLMPTEIERNFFLEYKLNKEDILDKVYNEPEPNVFLASFAPFLSDNKNHPFIEALVYDGLNEFFETNILSYSESKLVPVHFVGSIAWHFKETIHKIAHQKEITIGTVIQKPINGLADYFFNGGKMP